MPADSIHGEMMSFLESRQQVAPQGIGKPLRRREDYRFMTGAGNYADDMNLPGQTYAYVVRSPHAHARIAGIDVGPAVRSAGVLAVLTGVDAAQDGLQPVPQRPVPTNPHEVPLRQEMAQLEPYLEIQQIRFGSRLAIAREVEPETLDALVPTLVLQPLVENAVRHGVARKAGPAAVRIRAFRDGTRLALEVANDGPPPGDAARDADRGLGLRTTRGRLASLYGDDHELTLHATGRGAVARVSVPLHGVDAR